jgi:hypothetical protein
VELGAAIRVASTTVPTLSSEFVVDELQDARAQAVLFQQMSEAQNAHPIGDSIGAAQAHKVTVDGHFKQGFFCRQIRLAKPLLQAVDAQHHLQIKRRASSSGHGCMVRNKRYQLGLRHHQCHLVNQHFFAGATGAQIQSKVLWFHAIVACNMRASVRANGGEF